MAKADRQRTLAELRALRAQIISTTDDAHLYQEGRQEEGTGNCRCEHEAREFLLREAQDRDRDHVQPDRSHIADCCLMSMSRERAGVINHADSDRSSCTRRRFYWNFRDADPRLLWHLQGKAPCS